MPGPDRTSSEPGLYLRAAVAAWGWRLELGILLATWFAGHVALALGGLVGLAGVAAGAAIAVGALPPLRRRLIGALQHASRRRWLDRGLIAAGLKSANGTGPRLLSLDPVPAGLQARVRLPLGVDPDTVIAAAPTAAAALGVRDVRFRRDRANAGVSEVTIVLRDGLAGPPLRWPWTDAARTSLWRPLPLGADEDGQWVQLALPERNLLIGGEPGAGKSVALSVILATAALDPSVTLTLLDGKQVELAGWAPCAERFVGLDLGEAIAALDAVRAEMDRRYDRLLAAGRRKVAEDDPHGLHVVVIDELAFSPPARRRNGPGSPTCCATSSPGAGPPA